MVNHTILRIRSLSTPITRRGGAEVSDARQKGWQRTELVDLQLGHLQDFLRPQRIPSLSVV
jgi:hypothetical protein